MGTAARICALLGLFLLIAGAVYGLTSHEPAGASLLLIAAGTFGFVALVVRSVARRTPEAESPSQAEVHVAPTIWPFGFSVAAVVLMLGIVVTPWLFALGGLAFALSAAGWFRDVARSRGHADGH